MSACPRAWAMTYAKGPIDRRWPLFPTQQPPRTYDEVLVRTMRKAWLHRLEDQYAGKVWSNPYAQRTLERLVDDTVDRSTLRVPALHRLQGIERSLGQLRRLESTVALRPLFTGRPRRWAFFDRRSSIDVGGVQLYAAPDVAVFHQHRWTLIRLQFRAPKHTTVSQQLEHLLMIHWALEQPGFPDDPQFYRVKVVRWTSQQWLEHNVEPTGTVLKQAVDLVEHDVQEMTWLERWSRADPSLATLPLAVHDRHCQRCPHLSGCPAEEGLALAKRNQERSAREASQSDATKSANTA